MLTELLQNAVDHGFADGEAGTVNVDLVKDRDQLAITVTDDGRGLDGFSLDQATGLGLSSFGRSSRRSCNGTITMRPATVADLERSGIESGATPHGTVVELEVPSD